MTGQEVGSWGRPEWLPALWLLAPLALLAVAFLRSRARALARLQLAGLRLAPVSARLHRLRLGLAVAGLALCLLALAQPRWGYQWREVKQHGLSLVVVLDVSRSMDAQDVDPSRIERARRELLDLADLLRGDRIGLVLAAAGAYPRMPLTLDVDAFRRIVRDSGTDTLKAQGSDLGRAIEVGVQLLGPAGEADRALLIVSDGEDQVGQAEEAATAAAAQGVHIYALGIGSPEGAPIPMAEGGFKKDAAGRVVLTRLDRDLLGRLAEIGAGAYADSVAGTGDLEAIYVEGIRGGLRTADQSVRREKIWKERYQWPLAAGLAMLLLGAGLRPRPAAASAGRLAAILLASLLFGVAGPARAEPAAAPQQPALDELLAQQADRPGDMALAERVGQALYAQGDYNRAHEVLTGVAERSLDPEQRRRARSNAGLAAYRAGRLTRAVEDWERVLEESPQDQAAAKNAEAVKQEIAQRLQQQQEQQEQQQGQGEQGEQPPPEGQPQGQEGQPQAQEGQPQAQEGQPQAQEGQPQAQEGQPPEGDDGSRPEAPEPGEQGPTGEGELAPATAGADTGVAGAGEGEGDGEVHRPGTMSEQEADRLLEGVEEGSPRVEVDPEARRGGKDW